MTRKHLKDDAKNIHCWQYRQWLLRNFDLWGKSEWEYVEELISEDEFNNSAWNQRAFLLQHAMQKEPGVQERDLQWTTSWILNCSKGGNESAWNYLLYLTLDFQQLPDEKDDTWLNLKCKFGPWDESSDSLYIRYMLLSGGIEDSAGIRKACQLLNALAPMQKCFWDSLSSTIN